MAGGNFFVFVSYLIMIKGYFYAPDLMIVLCFVLIKIYFNAKILILSSCGVAANQAWANIRYFCILRYLFICNHFHSIKQLLWHLLPFILKRKRVLSCPGAL